MSSWTYVSEADLADYIAKYKYYHDIISFGDVPKPDVPKPAEVFANIDISAINGVNTFINPTTISIGIEEALSKYNLLETPIFNLEAPTINLPNTPSSNIPEVPAKNINIKEVALPEAPTINLPDIPTLLESNNIVVDEVGIPNIELCAPIYNLEPPSNNYVYEEGQYDVIQLKNIRDKLQNDLLMGGYGIETSDEQAIWDRARERENQALSQNKDEMISEFAGRGFSLPNGVMFDAMEKLNIKGLELQASLNRDVALKRSELYQNNRQFTITQAMTIEKQYYDVYASFKERQLNSAKTVAQLNLDFYRARIDDYNARVTAFRAMIEKINSLLAQADQRIKLIQAKIQAEASKQEINKSKIAIYEAQISSLNSMASIYNTQVSAAKTIADIERMKIENYKSEIDAFVAVVQAKSAQFGMYEQAIKGETAKVDIYAKQVDAYTAEVGALKQKSEVIQSQINGTVEAAKIKLDKERLIYEQNSGNFSRTMEKLQLTLEQEKLRINTKIASNGQLLDWEKNILSMYDYVVKYIAMRDNKVGEIFKSDNDYSARKGSATIDADARVRVAQINSETSVFLSSVN